MFCRKVVGFGLSVALAFSGVVISNPDRVSAYTIKDSSGYMQIEGVRSESIEVLKKVSIKSDLEMLDDVVERAYNNNFDVKSYIIESDYPTIDSSHWQDYLITRSDVFLNIFDIEKVGCVHDVSSGKYYHCVQLNVFPYWESLVGYWDSEKRKIKEDVYNDYRTKIENAERNMGFIDTPEANMCEYELLWNTYLYMAQNITYGLSNDRSAGQSAIVGVRAGTFQCAGYARLLNRFCYDFGIDCYWIGILGTSSKKTNHASNIIKLNGKYYSPDYNRAFVTGQNNDYNGHNSKTPFYPFDKIYDLPEEDMSNTMNKTMLDSILYYNKDFVNSLLEDSISSFEYAPVITENWFQQYCSFSIYRDEETIYGEGVERCGHCNQIHSFPWSSTAPVPKRLYVPKDQLKYSYSFSIFEGGMDYPDLGYVDVNEGTFTIYQREKEYTENSSNDNYIVVEEYVNGELSVLNGEKVSTKETVESTSPEPSTTEPEVTTEPTTTEPEVTTEPTTSESEVTTSKETTTEPEATTSRVEPEVTTIREEIKTTSTATVAPVVTKLEETTTKAPEITTVRKPNRAKIKKIKTGNIEKTEVKFSVRCKYAKKIKIRIKRWDSSKKKWTNYTYKTKIIKKANRNKYAMYKLTGLKKNTKYRINVKGINDNKKSKKWSVARTFTTKKK